MGIFVPDYRSYLLALFFFTSFKLDQILLRERIKIVLRFFLKIVMRYILNLSPCIFLFLVFLNFMEDRRLESSRIFNESNNL